MTIKKSILYITLFISTNVYCQTKYSKGFSDGYKIGYCYNKGIGCISPIPPISPLCQLGESYENYIDGYNRGLLMGATAGEKNSNSQSNKSSIDIYGNQQYIPKNEVFKPDYAFYEKALKQSQTNYEKEFSNNKAKENADDEAYINFFKNYLSPENGKIRQEYIKLLNAYYNDIKVYPSKIPDGFYKVTITTEPQPGFEKISPRIEEGEAGVLNNKIVSLKTTDMYTGKDDIILSIDLYPNVKNTTGIGITENYSIQNGIGLIGTTVFLKNTSKTLRDAMDKIYFIDYILQYQKSQKCVEEIKIKYNTLKYYPKIQDGWNIVYANDGEGFCEVRKVFVDNGKITLYKTGDGKDIPIISGGRIIDNKTTISYERNKENPEYSKTIIIEIYFL